MGGEWFFFIIKRRERDREKERKREREREREEKRKERLGEVPRGRDLIVLLLLYVAVG